jgi:hypothetical protein
MTNDWVMLENRSPKPKPQPLEVLRFIRRPAKKGKKLLESHRFFTKY